MATTAGTKKTSSSRTNTARAKSGNRKAASGGGARASSSNGSSSESSMPVKMAKSALIGLAGSVAIGAATRAASRRSHRTRILDVKKLSGKVGSRDLLKRIGDVAEVIEARSDEVRTLSGQAKRLSRKLV